MNKITGVIAMLNEQGPWGGGGKSGGEGSGGGGGKKGGGGPRNPWNFPPDGGKGGGGGRGPSALDQLLGQAKGRFGGNLPTPDTRLWGYAVAGLFALWIVFTSFHQIDPQERGVVTRLGKYSHTLEPGIAMTLPAPFDRVETVPVNVRTTDVPGGAGERLVLTGDQNLIDLEFTVRWTIRDPELYLFQSVDPETTIKSVAESTMRAALANMTFNQAVGSGRNVIEGEVTQRMQAILDSYRVGVRVQGTSIRQTDPPASVVDAFKEVSAAQQRAQTSVNQARTYAQQIIQKAEGEAGAFDRVYVQYKASPEVTRRRMYYETMERVLSKVDKTIVESGVTPYIPLPGPKSGPTAATQPAQQGGGQ